MLYVDINAIDLCMCGFHNYAYILVITDQVLCRHKDQRPVGVATDAWFPYWS